MYELSESYEDFEDDSQFALSVLANISIVGDSIPESLLEMYLTPVKEVVDAELIYGTAAYFHSSEILSIGCDCTEYNPDCLVRKSEESDWHSVGIDHRESGHAVYNFAISNVLALREMLA
jgi:hypothetical protein